MLPLGAFAGDIGRFEAGNSNTKKVDSMMALEKNIEIGSFASLPAKTGLGSSSSFSVALVKGLYAFLGKRISAGDHVQGRQVHPLSLETIECVHRVRRS